MRSFFVAYVGALVAVGVVVVALASGAPTESSGESNVIWAAAIALVGVVSVVVVYRFRTTLDCSSDAQLASTYRTRFFLRVAFSNVVAMVGFVATFYASGWWLYYFALPFTAAGMVHAAPSARNLQADQRTLRRGGCERWILTALAPRPPDPNP